MKYTIHKLLILIVISALATACSSVQKKPNSASKSSPKPSFSKTSKSYSNKSVIKNAKAMIGVNYHYGGISPKTGFDCSGLVYYSFKKQGVKLPRTTTSLLQRAKRINKSALRPGDLVFFAINRRTVSHVGIYLGNNKFIHSPSSGKKVNITSMNSDYWRVRFVTGGRI